MTVNLFYLINKESDSIFSSAIFLIYKNDLKVCIANVEELLSELI